MLSKHKNDDTLGEVGVGEELQNTCKQTPTLDEQTHFCTETLWVPKRDMLEICVSLNTDTQMFSQGTFSFEIFTNSTSKRLKKIILNQINLKDWFVF